jgi:ribonuclease HI
LKIGKERTPELFPEFYLILKNLKEQGEVDKVDFILNPIFFDENPIGFFDGAVVNDNCGVGIFIKLSVDHSYKAHFAGGKGNNMKAEILGLWGLLFFAQRLSIRNLMVVGDSKVTIDWINDCSNLNLIYLHSWKEQIRCLKASFEGIHFMHIHREFNTVADQLSKKALDNPLGWFFYEEIFKENVVNTDSFLIF